MTGIYSFTNGPNYRGASRQEMFDAALDQPLSITSTLLDQAKGGLLESYGAGTLIRDAQLPAEAPTTEGVVVGPEGSQTTVPNTRTLQRRIAAFGDLANVRPETAPELSKRRDDMNALDEDAYKASPWFRDSIPYDPGMTEARAAALASMNDAKRVREFYAQKRPFAAFIGNMAGQALDPINYVPVAGPVVRAAAVARMGKVAGTAAFSALDAAANTALFGIATADERAKFGDDVSWQSTVSQIATAALIGSAFGAIGGAVGRRVDARVKMEAETRLSTLRTTQEARIALNEGIDALVNGEDVRLSPNSTGPMARVAGEIDGLSKAYDRTIAETRAGIGGDKFDPLVQVTPEDIEGAFVARGGFKGKGDIEVRGSGYGLVKFALKHGELSGKAEPERITKQDILDFPNVIREYEPQIREENGVTKRNWVVEKPDGRKVVYADRPIAERGGERGLVTVHVDSTRDVSQKRAGQSPETTVKGRSGDTAPTASLRPSESGPTRNITQRPAIDNSTARPDAAPEGIKQAEAAIAKPDDSKAMASQYRVDPETGAFHEEADLRQLAAEGRFTEQDAATMVRAQADYEEGAAYAEALKSVAGCLL